MNESSENEVSHDMIRLPFNPVQLLNALYPMVVTEFGMTRLPVNPLHASKALLPIDVTELPIVRVPLNPLQFLNA